jgi:hypothetical protein
LSPCGVTALGDQARRPPFKKFEDLSARLASARECFVS